MSRRRVATTKRADDDIHKAVAHYVEEGAADAALGFIDALEEARSLLSEHPSIGSPRFAIETGIAELRGLSLHRIPYVVLYADEPPTALILRVLHTSRDIPAELSDATGR